jgi:hypothetical protein
MAVQHHKAQSNQFRAFGDGDARIGGIACQQKRNGQVIRQPRSASQYQFDNQGQIVSCQNRAVDSQGSGGLSQ